MHSGRKARCIIGIMLITMITASNTGCLINDDNTPLKLNAENINTVEISENKEMLSINLNFKSFSKNNITEKFTIDSQSFFSDEKIYNHRMAKLSFALSVSAFSSGDTTANWGEEGNFGRENKLKSAFNDLKLTDQTFIGYDKSLNSSKSQAAFGIGKRDLINKKEKCNLVVVAIRGGGYGAEWADNFNVGNSGKYHNGFEKTANYIKEYVDEYIKEKCTADKIRLLITGYSRGGAVANVLASKYQSDLTKNLYVYAYTFATPNTVIKEQKTDVDNIYNIIVPYDVITALPPSEWGFAREGKDIIMPLSDETEASKIIYNRLYYYMNELTGEKYNVTDANKINAFREIMLAFAQTREEFANSYQPVFEDMMIYFMTKVKKDKWVRIGFKDYIYEKYSSKAKKAFEKLLKNNNMISVKEAGITLPEELIAFIVLCEIHNINLNEISISSIKMETLKNMFSLYSKDTDFFDTRLHAPETYLSWIKVYDFETMY